MTPSTSLSKAVLLTGALLAAAPALAQAPDPGPEALVHLRDGAPLKNVVQNRFILKAERFEITPSAGYIPNNPMVRRVLGGANMAYHFNEQFAASAQFLYSPDLGETDLKGLTNTLVNIAHGSSDEDGYDFKQPVDKMVLSGVFSAQWAPIYGKINLLGETILNFDIYGGVGFGMLAVQKAHATYDQDKANAQVFPPVTLDKGNMAARVPLSLGVGMDFFVNQGVAVKIDARSLLYVDGKPDYGGSTGGGEDSATEGSRVYNNFCTTAGLAFYFPKMKPRISNF